MHILQPAFDLPQQDRLSVDANTEQRVGFTTKVLSFVEARLAVQLVRSYVKIPVGSYRECVWP